jgi:HSP20 family protein
MPATDEKFFEELAASRVKHEEKFEAGVMKVKATPVKIPKTIYVEPREDDASEGTLIIDVFQTPTEVVVESVVAGVHPDELEITATNETVTIRGERRRQEQLAKEDFFYQECFWGRFSRSVILPQEVDPDGASVNYKNGILSIRLPKLARHKSKKLDVQAA